MNKNKLIIVVGPNGVGKTRLTDFLRDNLESCNLYRLSGHQKKDLSGLEKSKVMYEALLQYLKKMETVPMTLLFDSFFFTEEVHSRLKYKEYDFSNIYQNLLENFLSLNYDIYYINLYLENQDLFIERLSSRDHHKYHDITVESSIEQQVIYQNISDELKQKQIKVLDLKMDDYDKAYNKLCNYLNLK